MTPAMIFLWGSGRALSKFCKTMGTLHLMTGSYASTNCCPTETQRISSRVRVNTVTSVKLRGCIYVNFSEK